MQAEEQEECHLPSRWQHDARLRAFVLRVENQTLEHFRERASNPNREALTTR